ncbi:pepsin A [Dorcoceras hygrometricum]|uniref:Pepsin A n=1 Tax=Dorcoceras hygrometricum TaxID=472368 RepID=A0A2Z7B1L7_9LAMI|nr:pepsin A [Dorcoceras hygrometricum]
MRLPSSTCDVTLISKIHDQVVLVGTISDTQGIMGRCCLTLYHDSMDRSELIFDRDYDEATTVDLKPIFLGPRPDPGPLTWQTTPAPEGHGVKPQYGEQYKRANGKQQTICKCYAGETGYNRDIGSQRISRNCSTTDTNQLSNSDHGMCEYMGATHSSQHTTPDAKHSSTRCCPTHEMWELPTPLIVANRSQAGR